MKPDYYSDKEVFSMMCKIVAISYIVSFTLITISYL